MFRILMPTDGSNGSLRAAEWAADKLCRQIADAEVTVLYVKELGLAGVDLGSEPGLVILPTSSDMQRRIDTASDTALRAVADVLRPTNRPVVLRTEWGRASDVICKIANDEQFDVVVMGKRGLGVMGGILLGSVSDRVVHSCRVPVLTIHE